MAANASSIFSRAQCYTCFGASLAQGARMVLFADILTASNPGMATDPNTLMAWGKCFACEGLTTADIMELALLDLIKTNGGGGGGGSQNLSDVLSVGNNAGDQQALNFDAIAIGSPGLTTADAAFSVVDDLGENMTYLKADGTLNFGTTVPSVFGSKVQIRAEGANGSCGVFYNNTDTGGVGDSPWLTYSGVGANDAWGLFSVNLAADVFVFQNAGGGRVGILTPSPTDTLDVNGTAHIAGATHIEGTLLVDGKITGTGGIDPPYVLYDLKTREEIKGMVLAEVEPDKQTGAALFFNTKNNKLETYVAIRDKFYDMQGLEIDTGGPVIAAAVAAKVSAIKPLVVTPMAQKLKDSLK